MRLAGGLNKVKKQIAHPAKSAGFHEDSERSRAMQYSDKAAWQKSVRINSGDPYSKGVVDYARRWANRMEKAMKAGETLEACAGRTSHEANTNGITGFMYGAAVHTLAKCWKHGNQLRIWHNASYGVDDEKAKGGTVNPAVLTIDTDKL